MNDPHDAVCVLHYKIISLHNTDVSLWPSSASQACITCNTKEAKARGK